MFTVAVRNAADADVGANCIQTTTKTVGLGRDDLTTVVRQSSSLIVQSCVDRRSARWVVACLLSPALLSRDRREATAMDCVRSCRAVHQASSHLRRVQSDATEPNMNWTKLTWFSFYARKQNASRVFAIVWASVRLSVCHTRGLYQNGAS